MSGREAILNKVRGASKAGAADARRIEAVGARLANAPRGVIPARGQLPAAERIDLFCEMAVKLSASVERVQATDDVPASVAAYLRSATCRPPCAWAPTRVWPPCRGRSKGRCR